MTADTERRVNHDDLKKGLLPLARGPDGAPVYPSATAKGPFTCFGCDLPMSFRNTYTKRKRAGVYPGATHFIRVRGHFAHVGDRGACHPEGWMHRTAKALLVARPDHPFSTRCDVCGFVRPFEDLPPNCRWVAEQTVGVAGGDHRQRRIVDVGLLDAGGAVVGAVEVLHTHGCDHAKVVDVGDALGARWCEVRAAEVIEKMLCDQTTPIVVYTALGRCPKCPDFFAPKLHAERTAFLDAQRELDAMNDLIRRKNAASDAIVRARTENEEADRRRRLLECDDAGYYRLTVGRYRGVVVGPSLLRGDFPFVSQLAEGKIPEAPPAAVHAAKQLMRGRCVDCGGDTDGPDWKIRCTGCYIRYKDTKSMIV
jgi:hypothetical protein